MMIDDPTQNTGTGTTDNTGTGSDDNTKGGEAVADTDTDMNDYDSGSAGSAE